MRPLRTGVGCVPAEVVGEIVLNLCDLQRFVSRWGGEEDEERDELHDGQDETSHLELRLPISSLWVTQEGDECGAHGVLLIVVLGAVGVRQFDQAVIVRQVGVSHAETPRPQERDHSKMTHLVKLL